jgi:hypothetical protein
VSVWVTHLVMSTAGGRWKAHPPPPTLHSALILKGPADARVDGGKQAAGEGEKSVSSRIALLEGDNSWLRIQVEELAAQKGQVMPTGILPPWLLSSPLHTHLKTGRR